MDIKICCKCGKPAAKMLGSTDREAKWYCIEHGKEWNNG